MYALYDICVCCFHFAVCKVVCTCSIGSSDELGCLVKSLSFFFFLRSGTMSGKEEFSLLDGSNKELPRSRMKGVRYVNFDVNTFKLWRRNCQEIELRKCRK